MSFIWEREDGSTVFIPTEVEAHGHEACAAYATPAAEKQREEEAKKKAEAEAAARLAAEKPAEGTTKSRRGAPAPKE